MPFFKKHFLSVTQRSGRTFMFRCVFWRRVATARFLVCRRKEIACPAFVREANAGRALQHSLRSCHPHGVERNSLKEMARTSPGLPTAFAVYAVPWNIFKDIDLPFLEDPMLRLVGV